MAGRGRAPKDERMNPRDVPKRGDWQSAPEDGWRFGEVPEPPDGLLEPSREAWRIWMQSWFAAFWTPSDLPGLRQLIRIYDQVERGEFQRANELRLQMDTYGVTPKGQQDRRWKRPEVALEAPSGSSGTYAHLRAVND